MGKDNWARGKIRNVRCAAFAAAACLVLVNTGITVKAEPVSLESSSATVYGLASEESSVMGSLIQGSTFEYQGDVTAEDGSVWRMVVMTNGITGYIRGDVVFSSAQEAGGENEDAAAVAETAGNDAAQAAAAENEAAQTEAAGAGNEASQTGAAGAGNGASQGGTTATGNVGTAGENLEGAGDMAEPDGEEETADDEAVNAANSVSGVENNREKTYAIGATGSRVKEKESQAEADEETDVLTGTSFLGRLDKTLLFSVFALICTVAVGIFFFDRMKKERAQLEENWNDMSEETAYRHDRKYENRKRKNRRKKNKRKKTVGKEGI